MSNLFTSMMKGYRYLRYLAYESNVNVCSQFVPARVFNYNFQVPIKNVVEQAFLAAWSMVSN